MAFAMQVAAKQRALEDCPHVSDEASASLSEASAPPMKLIKIGAGDKQFEIGQETVMFRHDVDRGHSRCIIMERLAHAHQYNISQSFTSRIQVVDNPQQLTNNLAGPQMANEPHLTCSAKDAAHGTTNLST